MSTLDFLIEKFSRYAVFSLDYVKFRESDIMFMLQCGDFNAQIDNWCDNLIVVFCRNSQQISTSKTFQK